jgi:hypothetical protein
MIPGEVEDGTWARLRQGVSCAAKAAIAIGALAGLAQYVSRTTLDRAGLGQLISHRGVGPQATGSVRRPKPAGVRTPQAGIDQAAFNSLTSVMQRSATGSAEAKR